MSVWWSGLGWRHKLAIALIAVALALAMLLWLDAGGAGDPRLCRVRLPE